MEGNIDMMEELSHFYEAAGFANFYEKVLKNKSEQEIQELYKHTFEHGCLTVGERKK